MNELFDFFDKFQVLSGPARNSIHSIATEIHFAKNSELQSIGQTCRTIYFLKKGVARIFYFKEDIDVTESFSFENSLVVRYESLIGGIPSNKGIQLLEDSELIALKSKEFFALFDSSPEIESLYRKIIESELVDQIKRTERLQFHTANERYADLMKQSPRVIQRIPLKYIASYLGITPVSLSRIRADK